MLGIEVVGTRGDTTGRLAITRTLLPWVPATTELSPTGFSWVWPLVDVPVRLADGTFANDSLAARDRSRRPAGPAAPVRRAPSATARR